MIHIFLSQIFLKQLTIMCERVEIKKNVRIHWKMDGFDIFLCVVIPPMMSQIHLHNPAQAMVLVCKNCKCLYCKSEAVYSQALYITFIPPFLRLSRLWHLQEQARLQPCCTSAGNGPTSST